MIVRIDYKEGDHETYRGVRLDTDDERHHFFSTGNPVEDFSAAIKLGRDWSEKTGEPLMLSSSCDQFGFDHPNLEWREDLGLGEILAWKPGSEPPSLRS